MLSESKYRGPHLINKLQKDIAEAKKHSSSQKLKTLLGRNDQREPVEELEKQLEQELLKPKAITERESIELPNIYGEQVKKV
ncbi:hypothetical protein EDC94DRAFT_656969 [Helicostylum pulchrum]|nr:hypothetical protein EDC94DRAFT_656969 [Helicostylum pulchrum]